MRKIDKRSRYAKTPVSVETDAFGEEFAYFGLREIPRHEPRFEMMAGSADRLDLLADRFYHDATHFWKIGDACDVLDPFDLVVKGRTVRVPPDKPDKSAARGKKGGKR